MAPPPAKSWEEAATAVAPPTHAGDSCDDPAFFCKPQDSLSKRHAALEGNSGQS